MHLSRVLDNGEIVLGGEFEQRVHVDRMPVDVYRHNRARAGGDLRLDLRRVDAEGFGIGIDENGDTPVESDRRRARDDRE